MRIREITSPENPKFRLWQKLLEAKGIRAEKRALVSGAKLVRECLEQFPGRIESVLLPPRLDLNGDIAKDVDVFRLSSPLHKALDVLGTRGAIAVVRVDAPEPWIPAPPQGLELVVALGEPSNLGALLRSAEAFGARRVILTAECASPFLPKAIKASALSSLRVPLFAAGPLAGLALEGALGLDMEGVDIREFQWPKNAYLVLGEEGQGLPDALSVQRLRIPMSPQVESLNATVAASIALFCYGW